MTAQFIDFTENLRKASINQRILIQWLIAALTLLSLALIYVTTHHAQFLIPYGLNKPTQISIHHVTPNYLTQLAMADAATYFDIDRSNANTQAERFLSRVDPSAFGSVEIAMKQRNNHIIHEDIAEVFYPEKRYVTPHSLSVVIVGHYLRWLSGKCISHKRIRLNIDYINRHGYLFIHRWQYTCKD